MAEVAVLVKPPQNRRGKGLSMVHHGPGTRWGFDAKMVHVKTQYDYNCRPGWRLWRATPTFACESHALRVCQSLDLNVPRVLSFRTMDGVTELVVEEVYDSVPLPFFWAHFEPSRMQGVLRELGRMVGKLHQAGWTHGAIAGAHVLVQPHEGDCVWLIDFEKARRTWSEKRLQRDLARFFRRSPYLGVREIDCFFDGYRAARK